MIAFYAWAEWAREVLRVLREILVVLRDIKHIITKPITSSVAVQFTGESMQPNNVCVLSVGQTSEASLAEFLADGVSLSGGVPSNVVFSFSDPSATLVLNSDGVTATVTGIAASSGPIPGSVAFTVTDIDNVVSQWNQPFTIQTNAVATQLTQSVAVQFTDPSGAATPKSAKVPNE